MDDVKEGKDYNFPKEEETILHFWNEIDAFQEQLRRTEGKPEFVFYDGPPFATGLPHYGHILAGTIKVSLPSLKQPLTDPLPPGHRHALRLIHGPSRLPSLRLGLPWPPRRIRN